MSIEHIMKDYVSLVSSAQGRGYCRVREPVSTTATILLEKLLNIKRAIERRDSMTVPA